MYWVFQRTQSLKSKMAEIRHLENRHDVIFCWSVITRRTLVWQAKFAVFFSAGYRYLGDGDTDRREILHDGRTGRYGSGTGFLPFWGRCPR